MRDHAAYPDATLATSPAAPTPAIRIFAVVVVYRIRPADSPSFRTLLKAAGATSPSRVQLHLRVVDNTPGGQDPGPLPPEVEYCAFPDNPGLSRPYNQAWRSANRDGYGWLLTLDQDTALPEDFFHLLEEHVRHYQGSEEVAAIVPRIVDSGRPVSPLRFRGGFLPVVVPAAQGFQTIRHALAFNSASLVRISALEAVDGYDEAFPLHNSDTRLFQKLDKAGKRVAVANNIVVQHELAMMDRGNRMSGDRYRAMLADERVFWDLHMGFLGRLERGTRLLGRVVKDLLRGRSGGDYTGITAQELATRLLTRRRTRLARLPLESSSWKA